MDKNGKSTLKLISGKHYRFKPTAEEVRFSHYGQNGDAVFFDKDEYSFQDCFIPTNINDIEEL